MLIQSRQMQYFPLTWIKRITKEGKINEQN